MAVARVRVWVDDALLLDQMDDMSETYVGPSVRAYAGNVGVVVADAFPDATVEVTIDRERRGAIDTYAYAGVETFDVEGIDRAVAAETIRTIASRLNTYRQECEWLIYRLTPDTFDPWTFAHALFNTDGLEARVGEDERVHVVYQPVGTWEVTYFSGGAARRTHRASSVEEVIAIVGEVAAEVAWELIE